MWQDYAITAVIWLFVIFTIPMVKQVFKQGISLTPITTIPTCVGNYILMLIWITFPEPLWVSFFSSLSIGTLWCLMAIGSWKNAHKN
jgi:hypothetical protein